MSTMGAKIQLVPEAEASSAAARAVCSMSGKDSAEAVDNVVAYEQGDAKARGLHGQALVAIDLSHVRYAEDRADQALRDLLIKDGAYYVFARMYLHQLPNLLGKGHAAQQFVSEIWCGCAGGAGYGRSWGS
jgi:hypothetical protein